MIIYQKNNDEGGFTLVEVLMVMAILAIGILGVMTMQISATNNNSNARRTTDGGNYMASEFEWQMLQDYDPALVDADGDPVAPYPVGANPQAPYTVANVASGGPIDNTQQVDITVTLGPRGRPITITYYKADPF